MSVSAWHPSKSLPPVACRLTGREMDFSARQFAACESAESVEWRAENALLRRAVLKVESLERLQCGEVLQVVVVEFAAYVECFHRIGVGRCQQKCILQLPFLTHCNVAFCHEL